MNKTNDRREFIIKSASAAAVVASSAVLGACGDSQKPAEYRYGVASGDPLADTARMNSELQTYIDAMPAQYYWVHKRFKDRPDGELAPY